jgi:predicted glycoside hydrolase/deacetylase ChbG (UPF0249 family)
VAGATTFRDRKAITGADDMTEWNRRAALAAMAGGAAAATLSPALAATPGRVLPKATRRMMVRADDIGHSVVCNIGAFEAIDRGVVSTVDLMLDSPGSVDAMEKLRQRPWLSVGWHMHMWGKPVSDPKTVPSLVEHGGEFDGRFRMDLARSPDVVFEEAVRELNAQLERCRRVLGRVVETANGGNDASPWGRAIKQVVTARGIVHDHFSQPATAPSYVRHVQQAQARGEAWAQFYPAAASPAVSAAPQWASRKIVNLAGTTAYIDLLTDSVSAVEQNYDPVKFYVEDRSGILAQPADVVSFQAWHPGYVDYYVYRLGERVNRPRAQQFVVGRTQDAHAMCDPRLKTWIRDNRIALITMRDALTGSNDYQNHLRAIGSDLAMA